MPNFAKGIWFATRSISSHCVKTLSSTSTPLVYLRGSFSTLQPSFKMASSTYQAVKCGNLYNDNFRLYFKNDSNEIISPLHDIPMT